MRNAFATFTAVLSSRTCWGQVALKGGIKEDEDPFKVKLNDSEVDEEVAQMGPNMPRL